MVNLNSTLKKDLTLASLMLLSLEDLFARSELGYFLGTWLSVGRGAPPSLTNEDRYT